LVDSPGFDDTNRSDADILREIAVWLDKAYIKQVKLTGIVYLHRIFDNRLTGSAMKNLRMFRKLCGDQGLGSVVLATTHWSRVSADEGASRELELLWSPSMWKTLIEKGAAIRRQDNGKTSALQILEYLVKLHRQTYLEIQIEMAGGARLEETAAGSEVLEEVKQQKAKFDEEIKELRDEMEEAIASRDRQKQKEIKEMMEEFEKNKIKALENERKLAADRVQLRFDKLEEDRADRERIQNGLLHKMEQLARLVAELELSKQKDRIDLERLREGLVASQEAELERESERTQQQYATRISTMKREVSQMKRQLYKDPSCTVM
jgi:hypothetical protein